LPVKHESKRQVIAMNTKRFLALSAMTIGIAHAAETYTSATINADSTTLTIQSRHGAIKAPYSLPDQQGFRDATISSDGQMVGWLAETANCCTSYPLPTALVIYRNGMIIRTFEDTPPIFDWTFVPAQRAVAYRQQWAHGASPGLYSLHRIADGKQLGEFTCFPKDQFPDLPEHDATDEPVPDWVWPIAGDCPVRAAGR
jgi:hypothetical protein